jgi:hypothetical protein
MMIPDEQSPQQDFPWAWYKAIQAIVHEDPPPNVATPPVALLPWLYLAPMICVRNKAEELDRKYGITHVLSTNRMPPQVLENLYWELRSHSIDHHYVAADDQLSYDMMAHWDECREFLQQCCGDYQGNDFESTISSNGEERGAPKPTGKALVHCAAGMNRSGTIVAAAMMHFGHMDVVRVARALKESRGHALSNASFVRQLVIFAAREGHLGDKPVGYDDEPLDVVE